MSRSSQSGAHIKQLVGGIHEHLEAVTKQCLSEAEARPRQLHIWREVLGPDLREALTAHLQRLTALSHVTETERFAPGAAGSIAVATQKLLKEVADWLDGELEDYAAGGWRPRARPGDAPSQVAAAVVNNVWGPVHGPVLQAGAGAVQSVEAAPDLTGALAALTAVEEALRRAALAEEDRSDAMAEIATLRAQLGKRKPTRAVVENAVTALQALALGVGGNLATPHVEALMTALHIPN